MFCLQMLQDVLFCRNDACRTSDSMDSFVVGLGFFFSLVLVLSYLLTGSRSAKLTLFLPIAFSEVVQYCETFNWLVTWDSARCVLTPFAH